MEPNAYPDPSNALDERAFGMDLGINWNSEHSTRVEFSHFSGDFHDVILDNASTPFSYIKIEGKKLNISHTSNRLNVSYGFETLNHDLVGSALLDFDMYIERLKLTWHENFGVSQVHTVQALT